MAISQRYNQNNKKTKQKQNAYKQGDKRRADRKLSSLEERINAIRITHTQINNTY
jgi:hypothetical protein